MNPEFFFQGSTNGRRSVSMSVNQSSSTSVASPPSSPFPRQNPFDRPHEDCEDSPLTIESNVRLETDDETDLADAVATVSREEKATDLSRLLSDGLLAHLLPPLESSKAHVDDLLKKQNHVLEVIEAENQRYVSKHCGMEFANRGAADPARG